MSEIADVRNFFVHFLLKESGECPNFFPEKKSGQMNIN